jgi:hypothetical protein
VPEKPVMMYACLAAIWLTGFGLVRWMFPRPFGWSLDTALLLSLGIGAGAGVLSCLYFLALVIAGPSYTVAASVIGGAVIAALALALLTRRQGTLLAWAEGPEPPWYLRGIFLLAIALAAATFLVAVSNNPHGDEGAWSIWNLRARFLFRAGAFWRDAFSNDLSWSHPDYPLLLPGLVALCWKLAGHESSGAPIAIAFLFALGTAGVLTAVIGVLRGKTQALVAGTLLLGAVGFISLGAAQYGDVPLSFYILATLALLCLQDRHPEDLRFSALAGLMAGFAAWTRNEGIIFLVAVILARIAATVRFRDRMGTAALTPQMLRLGAGLLAPLAVVILFKLRVGGASDLSSEKPAMMLQHLADPGRWILMIESLVLVLLGLGHFLVPVVLVLGLYWYLVRFRVEERDRATLAAMGIALVLTIVSELVMDIAFVGNLPVEIATGLERALLHLWPAGVLLFFLASGPLELTAAEKPMSKSKTYKRAPKPSRRVAETR